jgi:hypothetical protein
MVWGLHWLHTGTILPENLPLLIHALNFAQVDSHFADAENEKRFRLTRGGVYTNPDVVRTFFYTYAVTAENSLWYFFFYRQNVVIAFAGEMSDAVDEPSTNRLKLATVSIPAAD